MLLGYNFQRINDADLDKYNVAVKIFEKEMQQTYPLGEDAFTINHGDNYFAFFRRLGNVSFFLINNANSIVGTACAIERNLAGNKFWYLCDLKISPQHRGKNLSFYLFLHMFYKFFMKTKQGYLISMDPNSNQIVKIFNKIKNFFGLDIRFSKILIYNMDKKSLAGIEKYLQNIFGELSYLSISGKKDLILSSTQRAIPLYHLQHGVFSDKKNSVPYKNLPENAMIMFCVEATNPVVLNLQKLNITTNISATIISHKMDFMNWNNILTSEI